MKNKAAIVAFIVIFAAIMFARALPIRVTTSQAYPWPTPSVDTSADYDGYPGPDDFCQCCHDYTYGTSQDTFATLGMHAEYDLQRAYTYNLQTWIFVDGVGGGGYTPTYWIYGPMQCDVNQNGIGYEYYDYDNLTYGNYYGNLCWELNWNMTYNAPPDSNAMAGENLAGFYDPSNPSNIWYIEAFPNPWTLMTAGTAPP